MSAPLDPRTLEALSNSWDTSGLRKLLVVLAICDSTRALPQEGGLPAKSPSPRNNVNEPPARRRKNLPAIDPEELPPGFATTAHFVRLGEIATVSKGKTGIKDALPGPYPLVVTAEGRSSCDHFDFEGPAVIIPTVSSTGHGDASLKRIHFQDGRYAVGSILAAVHPLDEAEISARFLFEYLSAFKDELLVSRMSGTANVSLTATKLEAVPVPLVSKAGQDRIAKVVRLCDALEAKGQLEAAQHAQLVQTLLGALTASATPDELADNWQRVSTHFDLLLDRPEAVDALEQTILQLAVRGLLVPQDPKDEPASELLQKIRADKERLIAAGKMKRDKPLPAIAEEDAPFTLPQGWEWSRIGDLVSIKHGYAFSSSYFLESAGPFVLTTPGNFLEKGGFRDRGNRTKFYGGPVPEDFTLRAGDLIIAMTEQAAGLLGSAAFIPDDGKIYLHNQRLGKLIFDRSLVEAEYVFHYFNGRYLRACVADSSTGMKVKHTSPEKISLILFPLPPLPEQTRIVARVEALRRLCADLRQRLAARQITQAHLAEALIDEVG